MDAASKALWELSVEKRKRGRRDYITRFANVLKRAKRKAETPGQGFEAFKILKSGVDMEASRKEQLREQISIHESEQQRLANELKVAEENELAYKEAFTEAMKKAGSDAAIDYMLKWKGGGGLDLEDVTSMSEMAGEEVGDGIMSEMAGGEAGDGVDDYGTEVDMDNGDVQGEGDGLEHDSIEEDDWGHGEDDGQGEGEGLDNDREEVARVGMVIGEDTQSSV